MDKSRANDVLNELKATRRNIIEILNEPHSISGLKLILVVQVDRLARIENSVEAAYKCMSNYVESLKAMQTAKLLTGKLKNNEACFQEADTIQQCLDILEICKQEANI